ncbi:MAG: endonuclease/exonuclease/phosphatase family protein [Rothia sp. (in: high G+C Gram-positive bacteria)]|uniref:endonuclease/exonuclease/phosphatase family protein n=1 Tax=Rothia sp. (in: high G+C Gram-positive bacteria) TaxID=1885016 RepID=UPI0026FEA712|nr:endonuclease/exonuclease/phosphatase family protein [Rothia sp. (in: high G+C Gram-positive bacteria)]
MKLLTLNTHSWLEVHQIPKIFELAQFIVREQVDVVALQEVNQFVGSPVVDTPLGFIGGADRPVRQDNYALLLNQFLEQLGSPYYWAWSVSHLGFDRYDEGVALLTRKPFERCELVDLSPTYTDQDVARRVAVAVQLGDEFGGAWVASTHMSWWKLGEVALFSDEFAQLERQMKQLADGAPVILAGDFNNAAQVQGEGYDLMLELGWIDTYRVAEQVTGEFTVHKSIHGWDNLTQALRIDLVLTDRPTRVRTHEVVFPDTSEEAISDHSGLYLTFDL